MNQSIIAKVFSVDTFESLILRVSFQLAANGI